jgi:hypothetical protein
VRYQTAPRPDRGKFEIRISKFETKAYTKYPKEPE